jgi:Family of unknown function (DUF5701)
VSSVREQAERLIELGVDRMAGLPADRLRNLPDSSDALLVVHPDLTPPSRLAPLLRVNDKSGFVVTDMVDVDEFAPIPSVKLPDAPLYLLRDLDRGDAMANWSPDEALPAIIEAGRTPLTLSEGVHWLLQRPDVLARGRCFMTIGSRRRTPPVRWTPGRLPCGSAMAPAATGPPIATRRRSAGAGLATGIPGSGSPRPVADSPSTDDRQPHLAPRHDGDATWHGAGWLRAALTGRHPQFDRFHQRANGYGQLVAREGGCWAAHSGCRGLPARSRRSEPAQVREKQR